MTYTVTVKGSGWPEPENQLAGGVASERRAYPVAYGPLDQTGPPNRSIVSADAPPARTPPPQNGTPKGD